MNLALMAPLWLVLLLCATVVAAAIEDVMRLRISNVTVGIIAVGAIFAATLVGWAPSLWQNLLVAVLILAIGTALFAAGIMGGGDIKLLAAVGLWLDLVGAASFAMAVAFAGAILALIFIVARIFRGGRLSLKKARKDLPYGVAIAAGGLMVIGLNRF